ncbi:MAG: ribosome-associated translation inhibitor RaiA [Actinobacteria bacterium]|nr:ribosome-associated translation inhibitor RaiA [Actinomycetota bacterium]
MQMIVKGRRMDVTPAIREYAEEKIGRVTHILNSQLMSAEVELYRERNRSIEKGQVAEVTVYTKGHVIRAKESASDMFAAIDLVAEKLESQVRKYKNKVVDRHTRGAPAPAPAVPVSEEEEPPAIVKTKTVSSKPMSTEEAILQMELLGHDFFVFRAEDTEGMSVLYRRNDGDYGLITSA